ncbi:uncharacterized protein LOC131256985 [Magnolia sinica]|uniref:uncharacterized protein LOC131256985 n=1 Tax=Magnolia sinica TaxID=86752 RepID=UPI00265AC496|nr:uncharacterized protein LOC131256985 [Magnolia sinica]XP_058114105.1 uncharacterized protein LOC131256985 [Magnolia sinica]XP_058114106.1 uncharacterized protein LOC131256985 [Magnolia sinica]XP_058114107.1 uncharacterized protein LOC131256985 [Magnolia sinica]XP_058114108.1 uncharacterized protein LOC131256985 [Magnolia sinica]
MEPSKSDLQIFLQSTVHQFPSRFLSVGPTVSLPHFLLSLSPSLPPSSSPFLSFNGKLLPYSSAPLHSLLPPSSTQTQTLTLTLHLRLPGGGGDGGATGAESRDCYLNMYAEKKPDKVDPNEARLSRWMACALSSEPLRRPAVVDRLGNLFNKEALVEALLSKKLPRGFGHIRGLKDMIPIELSLISGQESDERISFDTRFQCPITGLEFNGKYRFYALRGCGHVLSAKALKEVKTSACLVCHREFSELDMIVINPSGEEAAALRERLEEERVKLGKKKEKKARNGETVGGSETVCSDLAQLSGTKHGVDEKGGALLMATGVKDEEKGKKNLNLGKAGNGVSAKRFKATDIVPANATKEVYASIFTSSKKKEFKETYMCRSLPLGRN